MSKPWLIDMHHRMRTASFAMMFVATGLHVQGKDFGLIGWLLLGALFLVYPQVQYWRVGRAANPVRAEMQNLLIDSVLLGAYVAALGFSQWLAFSAMLGTLSNNAANQGWKGIAQALVALLGGALLWIAIAGFRFTPETDWAATIFCILGLTGYLLTMNNVGFSRNQQLRRVREVLRQHEQELLASNQALQQNLREIDELQVQLREQAIRDPLTGLHNRGYLDSTLERELARCRREGEALSLAMIDVDHFKNFNDCYGHQAGDECLKEVATALLSSVRRASDLVARYGGEEFSLILPHTDAAAALQMAEGVRRAVEALALPHEQSAAGRVTISIGVATMTGAAEISSGKLLRAADEALYRAKRGGRNQVQVSAADSGERSLANLVQLVWQEAHRCENAVIDDQHRALFGHANALLAAILAGCSTDEAMVMLDKLIQEVMAHFRDEEAIIAAAGLPGASEHAARHRELLERVLAMRDGFRAGAVDIGALFEFVAHELIARHMLGADRELFSEQAQPAEHCAGSVPGQPAGCQSA